MKIFTLLLALLSFNASSAVIDGCFRTISYNGSPVVEGPISESNLTKIYSITSPYYFNASHSPLKTKIVSIFKGFSEGWYSYVNPIIFEDLGKTEESDSKWTYSFEGYVQYASSFYSFDEADFLTDADFEWREDGLLYGKVYQQTKVLNRLSDFEVVLKKAPCPID